MKIAGCTLMQKIATQSAMMHASNAAVVGACSIEIAQSMKNEKL
jgi:hypothetical protein